MLLGVHPAPAATGEPIKIGFLAPLTGPFAQNGRDMWEGFKLYMDRTGYQLAGRKLEVIAEDSEGVPQIGLTKIRKLVEKDRINALAGIQFVPLVYASAPYLEQQRIPTLILSTPDDITKRKPNKWIIRVSVSASQPMHVLADYAYKTLGYRKVAIIALDNGFGHEAAGGFHKVFEDLGGRVFQKIWTPLAAQDYAPYLAQLRRDVDAVVAVYVAAGAVRFVKQYHEYGLKEKLPLIVQGTVTDESILRALGDEAVGITAAFNWAPTVPNEANRQFVQTAERAFGKTPSWYHATLFTAAHWLVEGIKAVGGNVEDRERLLEAIRKAAATAEDPRGPMQIDALGNPTQNIYLLKVRKADGRLENALIHTYPMVSQFWTYPPEEFLKMPVYTRDFPPLRP